MPTNTGLGNLLLSAARAGTVGTRPTEPGGPRGDMGTAMATAINAAEPPRTISRVGYGGHSYQTANPAWVEWDRARQRREQTAATTAAQQPAQDTYQEVADRARQPENPEIREGQTALIAWLQRQASGQGGPSAAETMLRSGVDAAGRQGQAMAASARPGTVGAATRVAIGQAGQMGLQAGQQASMLRAQEQQQAQSALAQVLGGTRGQDQDFERLRQQGLLGAAGGQTQLFGMNQQNQQFYAQLQQAMQLARMGQPSMLEKLLAGGLNLLPLALGG